MLDGLIPWVKPSANTGPPAGTGDWTVTSGLGHVKALGFIWTKQGWQMGDDVVYKCVLPPPLLQAVKFVLVPQALLTAN